MMKQYIRYFLAMSLMMFLASSLQAQLTPPTILMVSPEPSNPNDCDSVQLTITGQLPQGTAIQQVKSSVNGTNIEVVLTYGNSSTPLPFYNEIVNLPRLKPGSNDIEVVLKNTFGNSTTDNSTLQVSAFNPDFTVQDSICEGTTLQITAGSNNADNYIWKDDGNQFASTDTALFSPTDTGLHMIQHIVINDFCRDTVTKEVEVLSAPRVSFGSTDTFEICEGSVETLSATAGYNDYQWLQDGNVISGENSRELPVSSAGKYKVNAIKANGCSDDATRAVKELPVTQANVLQSDSQLIATTSAFAYQWLRDGEPIGGATDSSYIAQQSGSFQLVTFNARNNCQDTSAPKNVTITGIAEQSLTDQPAIYPLPADDVLNYRLDGLNPGHGGSLTIYNLQGEALRKRTINAGSKRQGSLSIEGMSKGLYILTYQSSKATFSRKIVIGK